MLRRKQFAFRVKTDVAILGAGFVIAGGADTYPAPPATPRHHPKLTTPFSPQTRNATCGLPHREDAMIFGPMGSRRIWLAGLTTSTLKGCNIIARGFHPGYKESKKYISFFS
jgi:hypothetical protein